MSRRVRQRLTAVLLGGLLLGAPLLANGLANAETTTPEAGQQSHPALVTATASGTPTPTPEPVKAIPAGPAHGSANPAAGTPRTRIRTPRSHLKHPPVRATKIKAKIGRSTGSSAPIFAGKPPSSKKAGARGVPTLDPPSPTGSASAAPALPGPDIAVEQVATTEPMSENGLIGLLAAVSIVLLLGVSAGVIRAIVSERASRTKIA